MASALTHAGKASKTQFDQKVIKMLFTEPNMAEDSSRNRVTGHSRNWRDLIISMVSLLIRAELKMTVFDF